MTTISTAAKFAIKDGFTHILASDGTITPLEMCFGRKNRASFSFVGGIGWMIFLSAKRGYYEVVSIAKG